MEIHKVKPIHSWRDFLKEYGIIVIGVLTALAGEQAVESWQWQSKVTEAHRTITEEVAANNENVFAFRVAIASCVDRQIAQADEILTALEVGRDPQGLARLGRPAVALMRSDAWESERASQVLTHLPPAELAVMSRYYALLPDFRSFGDREQAVWWRLSSLRKLPKGTTSSDLIRLRADLVAAEDLEALIVNNSKRQLKVSERLGVRTPPPDPVRVKNWCTMNASEYSRYRATQDLR